MRHASPPIKRNECAQAMQYVSNLTFATSPLTVIGGRKSPVVVERIFSVRLHTESWEMMRDRTVSARASEWAKRILMQWQNTCMYCKKKTIERRCEGHANMRMCVSCVCVGCVCICVMIGRGRSPGTQIQ